MSRWMQKQEGSAGAVADRLMQEFFIQVMFLYIKFINKIFIEYTSILFI